MKTKLLDLLFIGLFIATCAAFAWAYVQQATALGFRP